MASPTEPESISFSQHVSYFCSRFLAYFLPLFFFLVINTFYLKTYDSAQIKITVTQIGGSMLFIVWMIRWLAQGRWPLSKRDAVFIVPFVAFLVSGVVVWLHTPFKEWSSEETLRRIFYMMVAVVAITELRSVERMTRMWRWLIASAWVAIGYGLLQYINLRFFRAPAQPIDPFIWQGAFGHRVFSTFGNPNFYGNFLVIITPLLLASILKEKGALSRPYLLLVPVVVFGILTDKMTLGHFGGYDPSLQYVYAGAIALSLIALLYLCLWKVGASVGLPATIILFALMFLNLYATETKGAWMGFVAALGVTTLLIFEFFLRFDEWPVESKKYAAFLGVFATALVGIVALMFFAFVVPWLKGTDQQIGMQILWIPTLLAALVGTAGLLWLIKKPWNLKKVIYGFLLIGVITLGAGILQFAKNRLVSVSFRMFTWISTWEMVESNPVLGNGVGTFKIIYPAFRRPEIIVLEGRSNTETDHAEDEYLEVWQDEGIVGFGVFLWMVATALVLGFKQLRWYADQRSRAGPRSKKLFDVDNDPRSYEVLGYTGAYIGALIHWFVDVSIRFVSSGVFSGLLPAMLVAYARNHDHPVLDEAKLPYDRWIRASVAVFWIIIFLVLKIELVPQSFIQGGDTAPGQIVVWMIVSGLALFALMEVVEIGIAPAKEGKFEQQYPSVGPNKWVLRLVALPIALVIGFFGINLGCQQFWGDVHHNLAIFFSKEGIWTKSPIYDSKLMNYPPDIRDKYRDTGGALEHYKEVVTKNHAFPMAHYFTGNVYNDWGSQVHAESLNTRAKGDMDEALRLKAKASDMWNKAEEAYLSTKKLAPNYVQTHHQMGLLYVKRAEQAAQWGDIPKSKELYQEAFKNFQLYHMLDPVFVPNHDRLVQILMMDGKIDEALTLYKEALYYNYDVGISIHRTNNFADRVSAIAVSLAKLNFNQVASNPNAFHPPAPQVQEAIKYFQMATENDPKNLEAWKGLGFLFEKCGRNQDAQVAYHEALKLSPNDPDLKAK